MKLIILTAIVSFFVYALIAHIIHKVWNISPQEARKKLNAWIVDLFSNEPYAVTAECFLTETECNQLGNAFKRYFLNVQAAYTSDMGAGIFEAGYWLAGVNPAYAKHRNAVEQSIYMDIAGYYQHIRGVKPVIRIKTLTEHELVFQVAYSRKGADRLWNLNSDRAHARKVHQLPASALPSGGNQRPPQSAPGQQPTGVPRRANAPADTIQLGKRLTDWKERRIVVPIEVKLATHPHMLITGSSGSGKSYCLNRMLYCLSRTDRCLWLGDFKASEDFRPFRDCPNYAAGNDVEELITRYYDLFEQVRTGAVQLDKPQVIVLDEYPSFIQYLTQMDKKRAERIKQMISTLLMMGRNLDNDGSHTQFAVWLTAQRPDANMLAAGGARDNFMVWIALGNLSSEAKHMISDQKLPDTVYQLGEGIVKIDGRGIDEIVVPSVRDYCKMVEVTSHAFRQAGGGILQDTSLRD